MVETTDDPVFDLVDVNKTERRALIKADILALAYLDKGLNNAIEDLEKQPDPAADDIGALAYFNKLKEKVKYARSASLPE